MDEDKSKFDFDAIAGRYDRFNHWSSFRMDCRWRREMVKTLNPKMHQRLLDVCTGTGDVAFAFCRHSPIRDVTGLDRSEPMLSLAQEKQIRLSSRPWIRNKRLNWLRADAADTSMDGRQFDFITCAFGIRNVPNRTAALTEMHRLLKSGGKLCILEFSLPPHALLRLAFCLYLKYLMPAAGKVIFGTSQPLQYLSDSIKQWHTEVDFTHELAENRFSLVRKVPLTGGIVTLWLARK